MPGGIGTGNRLWRAGVILLAGWLLLEVALLQLVAARIGWAITLAFLSIKGGIGLILIGILALRGFSAFRTRSASAPGDAAIGAGFGVASGVLIALPGLFPALVGVALFSPSLQRAILMRFATRKAPADPKAIELEASEYRELKRRKLASRRRPGKSMA